MSDETWRAIPTFEGIYEVSDLGRVRSLDRRVTQGNGKTISARGRELKVLTQADGYRYVYLSREGKLAKCNVDDVLREVFGEDVTAAIGEALAGEAPPVGGELVPFDFDAHQVRVLIDLDGNPWWVAADVCEVLGIANVGDAVSRLSVEDVGTADVLTRGGRQQMKIINESGLYDLILDSRKPAAKRFRRWITAEVIPSIRRTGSYGAAPVPALPQTFADALRAYAAEVEAREAADAARELANAKVLELEPAAEQFHRWQTSEDTVYVVEWAKTIGLTQSKAYEALRELGVLFKQRADGGTGAAFNVPKRGWEQYFEIVTEYLSGPRQYIKVPKITAEGQVVLAELLMENGWIAP